ncbi:MAG: pyruvate ferredoxin oxidoreductase subunit gamma [Candidatus Geothermarchaeales archaeon]
MVEVRFHGRGGQGAVTASQILAKSAFLEGKWVQAFPFFGAERRGAPVLAFARISDEPILLRSQIYNPDIVVVLDPTLLSLINVTEGLKRGGTLIINTAKSTDELNKPKNCILATADATSVALRLKLKTAGMPLVNTAMLGAFAKATDLVKIDSVLRAIRETWGGKLGERNAEAAQLVYERTITKG